MRKAFTLICMGACLLLATQAAAQDQESLKEREKTPAEKLLAQGDEAFQVRNYAQAGELYKLAAMTAEREMIRGVQGEALAQVARSYLSQDKKEEGRPWLKQAREVVSEQMPKAWSRYLGVRGRFEWKDGKLEEATATFKEMYDYCLQYDLHSRAVDAAHMVAITAGHEEQIAWAKKGISAAEEGGIEGWLGPLWNNLGWTYEEMGRYQESLEALTKAREYHWKLGTEHDKLVADWSIGHAYRKLEQLEEAESWLRPVLAWAERRYSADPSLEAAEWVGHSHQELGEIAIARGEAAEGLRHLRKARGKLSEARMPEWALEDFQQLTDQIAEISAKEPADKMWHTVVHFEIPFDQATRAVSFYRDLFGWEILEVPEMDYWMVNTVPVDERGRPVEPGINGGMMRRAVPEHVVVNYISVASVEETLHKVESLGGTIIMPKTPIPRMGWFAHIADTEGNVLGIFEDDPGAE